MSKKYRQGEVRQTGGSLGVISHEAEYSIIKHDLIKVLALNVLYFAFILALYFSNQKSHFLDAWFNKILHF